jgi:predicted nucleic acid-binding protein
VTGVVVADASPLIAFQQIGRLPLLEALFTTLLVPPAVAQEVNRSVPRQSWIVERPLLQPVAPLVMQARLGAGEREAISLAIEVQADALIVDEKAARRLAASVPLHVIGSLGLLLAARRKRLIPAVRPEIEALLTKNFWISPQLIERALADIGEAKAD